MPLLAAQVRPAPRIEAKRLTWLIAQLDSQRFAARQQATRDLEDLGELAQGAMRKALMDKRSPEAVRRLELLLAKLNGPLTSPDSLRALRAVEILEHIGTLKARQVLQTLAEGAPEARLTEQARVSLKRLTIRPAGK